MLTTHRGQVFLARSLSLEPFVFIGERSFAEPQACEYGPSPYFDLSLGTNIWEYWFKQPGKYTLGARTLRGRPIGSLQVASVDHADRSGPVRAYGSIAEYKRVERQQIRRAAHQVVGQGGVRLVRDSIRRKASAVFTEWRQRSGHVLGMHVRGTDKVVQPKVPPEAYFPFVDAYFAEYPDALLFVATDDTSYLARIGRKYRATGRLVTAATSSASLGFGYRRRGRGSSAYEKGEAVLVDALLLSQCDFFLKATSAVAEFALWANQPLHLRHLDLQIIDRFRSQSPLPAWTSRMVPHSRPGAPQAADGIDASESLRRAVAHTFCSTLNAVCGNESAYLYRGGAHCSKCQPEIPMRASVGLG